jgi:hypothetical protein
LRNSSTIQRASIGVDDRGDLFGGVHRLVGEQDPLDRRLALGRFLLEHVHDVGPERLGPGRVSVRRPLQLDLPRGDAQRRLTLCASGLAFASNDAVAARAELNESNQHTFGVGERGSKLPGLTDQLSVACEADHVARPSLVQRTEEVEVVALPVDDVNRPAARPELLLAILDGTRPPQRSAVGRRAERARVHLLAIALRAPAFPP